MVMSDVASSGLHGKSYKSMSESGQQLKEKQKIRLPTEFAKADAVDLHQSFP